VLIVARREVLSFAARCSSDSSCVIAGRIARCIARAAGRRGSESERRVSGPLTRVDISPRSACAEAARDDESQTDCRHGARISPLAVADRGLRPRHAIGTLLAPPMARLMDEDRSRVTLRCLRCPLGGPTPSPPSRAPSCRRYTINHHCPSLHSPSTLPPATIHSPRLNMRQVRRDPRNRSRVRWRAERSAGICRSVVIRETIISL